MIPDPREDVTEGHVSAPKQPGPETLSAEVVPTKTMVGSACGVTRQGIARWESRNRVPGAPSPCATPLLPFPEEQPTLRLWPEAGTILGLSRSSTYAAVQRGEIPVLRFGRRIVVPTAALRKMLGLDS